MLFLVKTHTGTLIEQTKTLPQETPEIKKNEQKESYSLSLPINLFEEGNWMIAVTSFDPTNSVLKRTDENKSFSITIPGYWTSRGGVETLFKLREMLELREEMDVELRVEKFGKKGNRIKKRDKKYNLSKLDTHKN